MIVNGKMAPRQSTLPGPFETRLSGTCIDVAEKTLVDLRRRINATKWPQRETVADGSHGVRLAMMQDLARH
jgi:hypothetical protein